MFPAPTSNGQQRLPAPLVLSMVIQFAAGGAVIPFISLLMLDRGLEFQFISIILASSSATLLVFPFFWGMLADRWIRLDRLFIIMNLLACAGLALFAAQSGFITMLASYTFFFACFSPTLSLINALSFHHLPNPPEQFSKLRAWGSLGWIVPFLPISFWLAKRPAGLDFALYLGMGFCFSMALLSLWLPATPPGASRAKISSLGYGPALRRLLSNGNYLVLLIGMFLISGSYNLLAYYSPPYLEEIGVPRHWLGPVQAIGVVFEIFLFLGQPALIRRWNYTAMILLGCAALLIRHLLFALLKDPSILSASYLLAGAVIVFFHTGVSVLVNSMAAIEVRSTAQTLLMLFGGGLGPMFSNGVAGWITSRSGNDLRPVFWFASGLAALALLLIASRGRKLNELGATRSLPTL